ncbi:MAG TPA: S8 family serine peptidase [Anaerolineae bacterium]|nr:S8 family serine peptidase [Anaerolineae bacterium]
MNPSTHYRPALQLALTALLAALALVLALSFAFADDAGVSSGSPLPGRAERQDHGTGPYPRGQSAPSNLTPIDGPPAPGKIDPPLLKRMLAAAPGEQIPIIVEMRQQADLDSAPLRAAGISQAEAVVHALRTTAAHSQRGVRAQLAVMEKAGRASQVRSFWVFNGLASHVAAGDILALAARDGVGLIREDRFRQWVTAPPSSLPPPTSTSNSNSLTLTLEWGLRKIRADEVWAALNVTGTGIVVANMDTGVDWQHPALITAYRGYGKGLAGHAGNWLDATDDATVYPVDPHGHGTHTMGTIVGADGIGVAPGARWIAARVLNSAGFGYDSWIHAGFEWILAPDGDPNLAPDVLNNSWGSDVSASTAFQNDLHALRQAGIFAVFSAGNNGPDAGGIGSPASLPEAFAVGATDDEDEVAVFSSRGPSPWGEVRPHVAAPGVNVRSSVPGGIFDRYSGTSVAAPHVAGTAALMLAADPSLTITGTAFVLTGAAVPLSTTIPNNDSGYGRVDAYAAVQAVASMGTLSGTVARSDTGAPIAGATVAAVSNAGSGTASTGANGQYVRGLAASIYTVDASAFGYVTATQAPVFVITGAATLLDFALDPVPSGEVRGSLTDAESGQPISGTIVVAGTPVTASAAARGVYSATLPGGTFELRAVAWGHRALTATVTVTPGAAVTRDFSLPPAPTILLVDSGPWYYGSQIGYYRAALEALGYPYAEHRVKRLPADVPQWSTLAAYDAVIWSAPQDAPGFIGAGDAISSYLSAGGSLLLSGQDVGFWDGGLATNWSSYYHDRLKAIAVEDDSGSRTVSGVGVFAGLAASIAGPGGADNQWYPDAIGSAEPDLTADAFTYANGKLAGQTVGLCLPYRAAYLAFGLEAMTSAATRREVMSRTLAYFASPRNTAGMTLKAVDDVLVGPAGSMVTTTVRLRNIAEVGGSGTFTLAAQSSGWSVSLSDTSITLDACADRTITVTVSIPPGVPIDTAQAITLTARSANSPTLTVDEVLVAKSPAIALLVDDDRWYDVEAAYQSSLGAMGVSTDRWNVAKSFAGPEPATPSPERLSWYPIVIWFTGYDWYQPLTASNEATLTQYLDGGGRLLISSQSHLGWGGISDFSRTRLGVLDAGDVTTTLARGVPGGPFDGVGTLALSYTFPNWSENAAPYPTATVALVGSHGRPIALARHAEPGAGKTMFFSFPFEAIPESARREMMERAVGYLSWLGNSTVTADKAVAIPGSSVKIEIAVRNDGPSDLASASVTATLPARVSLQSGSTAWSGSLAPGQSVTVSLTVSLADDLPPGSIVVGPVAFTDGHLGVTFHKTVQVGIYRPDLSSSTIDALGAEGSPVHPLDIVTWTIVARNNGQTGAASATITGLLPLGTEMLSGTLAASVGAASELSGTVQWSGAIPAGGLVTITYQMVVTGTLSDRLYFSSALFDDGVALNHANAWLAVQPYRFYLPQVYR